MSLPNLITLGRLLSVPLMVWLISTNQIPIAFWVFVLAGVSDGVDGFLAKNFGWATELGGYLDPIADKAMLVGIYVTLGYSGHLPSWLVILVVSRDILIIGAVLLSWMLDHPVAIKPLMISKTNTVVQIGLAGLVLANLTFPLDAGTLVLTGIYLVAITTILSGASYLIDWVRDVAEWE